jgi:hypothetical protein
MSLFQGVVGVGVFHEFPNTAVYVSACSGRALAQIQTSCQIKHLTEHLFMDGFIICGQSGSVQCLAKKTGDAI